jgi:hypothetical protein
MDEFELWNVTIDRATDVTVFKKNTFTSKTPRVKSTFKL